MPDDDVPASVQPDDDVPDSVQPTPADRPANDEYSSAEEEHMHTPVSSEDEEAWADKYPMYNEKNSYGHVELEVGMEFPNLKLFREAVVEYNIFMGRQIRWKKVDQHRSRAVCKNPDCQWLAHCSWSSTLNTFQIKTFSIEHTCPRCFENHSANYEWVAKKLVPRLATQPDLSRAGAVTYMKEDFMVQLNKKKVSRALKKAREAVEGSEHKLALKNCKGRLPPVQQKRLDKIKVESFKWTPIWTGNEDRQSYEVHRGGKKVGVSLTNHTCTCQKWQLTGLPCEHAMASISYLHDNPDDYVHDWLTMDAFNTTYASVINPVTSPEFWVTTNTNPKPDPPKLKRPIGRPKKHRRRDAQSESTPSTTLKVTRTWRPTCPKCNQQGHYAKSCKGPSMASQSDVIPTQESQAGSSSQAPATNAAPSPAQQPSPPMSETPAAAPSIIPAPSPATNAPENTPGPPDAPQPTPVPPRAPYRKFKAPRRLKKN